MKSLKARQSVTLQGKKKARIGAFGLLGLSSPALLLVAGTAAVFFLRLTALTLCCHLHGANRSWWKAANLNQLI